MSPLCDFWGMSGNGFEPRELPCRRKQESYQLSASSPYNVNFYHSGSTQLATMLDPGTLTLLGGLPLPGTLLNSPHWGVLTEQSSLRSPHWGVLTEQSSLRSPHWGVLTEESSLRSPHRGSSLRSPHRGFLTEESSLRTSLRNPHRGVLTDEFSVKLVCWRMHSGSRTTTLV